MLAAIRQFFDRLTDDGDSVDMGEEQVRLAVAALLYHVITVDGVVTPAEFRHAGRAAQEPLRPRSA